MRWSDGAWCPVQIPKGDPQMEIKYNEHIIDTDALPAASIAAMLKRGLTHYLGNEQAAKVTNVKKAWAKAHNGADMPEDEIDAKRDELVAAAVAALESGTVGIGVRGPRIDPVEKIMESKAEAEVVAILKSHKLATKKPEDEDVFTLGGVEYTFADLVERRVTKEGDRLRADAEAEVARRKAAKAERDAAAKQVAGVDIGDALGL